MEEFSIVTAAVCAGIGSLGVVTNLAGLGRVLIWDVPGIGGPGVPVTTALTPHPAAVTEVCPAAPPCISLGVAFVLLFFLYNFPLS